MSETPRTDASFKEWGEIPIAFARKLEMELANALQINEQLTHSLNEERHAPRTEARRSEADPLTLELADELFGCFLSRAAPDADHSWECAVCDEPVTMPNWITSKHAEGCAVAKARDYLAQHAPHRTPGFAPSPLVTK